MQFLALLFVIFALWRVSAKKRKGELGTNEFISWFLFWLAVGTAFFTPSAVTKIANILGIGRGADLVLYTAVITVFYLMFRIFVRLEKMERAITKIVRENALAKAPDGKKDIKTKN